MQRDIDRRRLSLQLAVSRVLIESETLDQAAQRLLAEVCTVEGWRVGTLWWSDDGAHMRCRALYTKDLPDSVADSFRKSAVAPGQGVVGAAWESAEPAWSEVDGDERIGDDIRAAYAFPIAIEGEVIGVMEFFAHQAPELDPDVRAQMTSIGAQVGLFVESKRARSAATQAMKKLAYFISHAPVIAFAIDKRGRVLAFEGRGVRGLGVDPARFMGRSVFALFPGDHPIHRDVKRALAGETFTDVVHLPDVDAHFETHYAPVRNDLDQVTGVIGIGTDISERVRAETALQSADRMAAIGTLAAGVAHEINNPLTYVRLNIGRLISLERSQGTQDPLQLHRLEILQEAREGIDRVARIVRDLKLFARPDTAQRVALELWSVLDAAVEMARHEIKHRARLIRITDPVPPVRANESRLAQAFLNVIINAAQAIPEGEAHLNTIRIATSTDDKGRAVIEVSDTGTGMSEEVTKRIFDPYFTTKPHGGVGLGLSLCHGIVSEIGGEIQVDSRVGHGTTFRIALPAADQPAEAEAQPEPPPRKATVRPPEHARVLIVDDERAIAAGLAATFGPNHEVVIAGSGREAFEVLRREDDFDVIVCDLMMAEVTGIDLYEALKLVNPALARRIIFMTGGPFTQGARDFLARVDNPVLDKPFDDQQLHRIVRDLLEQVRQAEPDNGGRSSRSESAAAPRKDA